MLEFPKVAVDLIEAIACTGSDAYFVGGCVRDAILNMETKDIDICTDMSFESLKVLFSKYHPTSFERFGGMAFEIGGYHFEITRFRKEGPYLNHRHPSTLEFEASLLDDVMRRDFTINGLLYAPSKGLVDYVGGLDDLKNRILRTIQDPEGSFNEDYLRMLRLMRFKAKLNFDIENETFEVCKDNFYKVAKLPWSQLLPEFIKFIELDRFTKTCLKYPFILGSLFVEMHMSFDYDQNNHYHKYSLYEHTLRVIDHLDGVELRLAGLFHDLGKLKTRITKENGEYGYPGHAKESAKIAHKYLDNSYVNKNYILKIIEYHDLSIPVDYIEMKKLVAVHGFEFMKDLITFKKADNLSKSEAALYQVDKCTTYHGFLDRIEVEKPVLHLQALDIKGDMLDIDPLKRSEVLQKLLTLVIEEKITNSKIELLEEVKRWGI